MQIRAAVLNAWFVPNQAASPAQQITPYTPPLLLVYGGADEQVPVETADQFVLAEECLRPHVWKGAIEGRMAALMKKQATKSPRPRRWSRLQGVCMAIGLERTVAVLLWLSVAKSIDNLAHRTAIRAAKPSLLRRTLRLVWNEVKRRGSVVVVLRRG